MDGIFGNLTPAPSGEPARWVFDALHPFDAGDAGVFVPTCFEAYAAVAHGADPRDHEFDGMPAETDIARLAATLADATLTPERAWFCLWEGVGWTSRGGPIQSFGLDGRRPTWRERRASRKVIARYKRAQQATERFVERCPLVGSFDRRHHLFVGRVIDATAMHPTPGWFHSPNVWWPDDGAWVVASDVGLPWTYVAGAADVVDEIRAAWPHPTLAVSIDEQIVWPGNESP